MLAYSSIAQAGFMLLSIFALNAMAKEGLVLYAAAYSLATIGIFGVLVKMNDYTIDGFNGLAKQHPAIAVCTTIFLLSLTGIPLTAGFQSKFLMLMAAIKTGQQTWLVVFAVMMAAISAYYYFKIIQAMYFKDATNSEMPILRSNEINSGYTFVLYSIAVLIILLGIFPAIVTNWLHY
jgi:NADH-quinone oxidoreductase subunit N